MVTPVLITFAVTLLIGVPIAYVVLIAAGVGILGSGFSGIVVAQQTVSGINSFIMLAVPFFIISGDLAAKGKTSQKIVDTINAFIGHIPGGLGIAERREKDALRAVPVAAAHEIVGAADDHIHCFHTAIIP